MSTPRKPRTPRTPKPKPPKPAAPPAPTGPYEQIHGYDVHGHEISFYTDSPIGAEMKSAIDELPEGFKNEPAATIGDSSPMHAPSNGIAIPWFSDAEFRTFKVDLNKEIHTYEVGKTRTAGPAYLITNQAGIRQVSAYMALKDVLPTHEIQGEKFANSAASYIRAGGGCFLLGADDKYHIILGGRRIPIDAESRVSKHFSMTHANHYAFPCSTNGCPTSRHPRA